MGAAPITGSALPQGFTLDPPQGAALPPATTGSALPQGFTLDSPTTMAPSNDTQAALTTQVESGGKIGAINPNSHAAGLFQFTPATAKQYGLTTFDLVNPDPTVQARVRSAFDQFTSDNAASLTTALGRSPTPAELYLAHQQGATGAAKLLADPTKLARDVVGLAAVTQNGGTANMTAGDFVQLQEQRISKAAVAAMPASAVKAVSAILPDQQIGQQPMPPRGPGWLYKTQAPDQVANAIATGLVGAAHGGIDVPLHSLAEGTGWVLNKLGIGGGQPNIASTVSGIAPPNAYDAAVQGVDQYNKLYGATTAANSTAGTVGNIGGGIATAMLTPELNMFKGGSLLANAARGALGGGIYGAEQNSASGGRLASDVALNAGAGAVAGTVLPPVARAAGGLYRRIFGGATDPAAAAAVAAARERLANFKALGLEGESGPTMGMIGRDPTQFQRELDTAAQAGKGQPLVQRYQNINAGLKSAIDDLKNATGGTATTPYEAGGNTANALTTKWQEMQAGTVTPAYAAVMRPDNVLPADQFSELIKSNPLFPTAIKAVRADPILSASVKGLPDESLPVLDLAKRHLDDLHGGAIANNAPNRAAIAGDAAKQLTAKLDVAFPGYADARAAAEARFGEFDTKTMSAIQRGTMQPDDVIHRTLWAGKVADVDALKNALLTGTPEQIARGTAAWNDLRGQTMDKLITAGFGPDGAGKFSPSAFNKAVKTLGYERLTRIFTPQEMETLNRIRLAGNDAFSAPPFSSPNYSHSGTFLANEGVAGLGATALKAVNQASNVAGGFMAVPHTLVTRPLETAMQGLGARAAMRGALSPNIDAAVAAAARARAGQAMAALLQRLPMSQAAAAIYGQRQ